MQNKNSRPLSPHLTIYKPQITSIISISHRITGVILFFGLVILSWFAFIILCYDANSPVSAINSTARILIYKEPSILMLFISTGLFKFILFVLSYCLYFHICAGIRYLFWSCGKGFSLQSVNTSGVLILISSTLLTAITWFLC